MLISFTQKQFKPLDGKVGRSFNWPWPHIVLSITFLHGFCQQDNEMGEFNSGKRNGLTFRMTQFQLDVDYLRRSGVSWGMRR